MSFDRQGEIDRIVLDQYDTYDLPPLGWLIGPSLMAISFGAVVIGAYIVRRGSESQKKWAMRAIIAGNVGTVVAVLSWILLHRVYVW
jgi:hypothetical protein